MNTPPSETLNSISTPNETWTLVSRRRGKSSPNPKTLTLTLIPRPKTPIPWTPSNPPSNPDSESKLFRQIQSAQIHLKNSKFLRRFISRFRSPQIQSRLNSFQQIQIIAFGIGSMESRNVPRLQLALLLVLKEELGDLAPGVIEVFDPVFSAVDCAVLAALGCKVIDVNEFGRRKAIVPTIFYMPHCEAELYDNLLSANWGDLMLRKVIVLGNSFGVYEKTVREMGRIGRLDIEVNGRHLLGIMRYVKEVEMEERRDNGGLKEDYDDGDDKVEFFKAFQCLSWHFFEVDDGADLGQME